MSSAEQPSDTELLLAARTHSEPFGVFYERHVASVLAFFRRRVPGPEEAFDLTAETFAAALASVPRFEPGPEPPRAWFSLSIRSRAVFHGDELDGAPAIDLADVASHDTEAGPFVDTDRPLIERRHIEDDSSVSVQAAREPESGLDEADAEPAAGQIRLQAKSVEQRITASFEVVEADEVASLVARLEESLRILGRFPAPL